MDKNILSQAFQGIEELVPFTMNQWGVMEVVTMKSTTVFHTGSGGGGSEKKGIIVDKTELGVVRGAGKGTWSGVTMKYILNLIMVDSVYMFNQNRMSDISLFKFWSG